MDEQPNSNGRANKERSKLVNVAHIVRKGHKKRMSWPTMDAYSCTKRTYNANVNKC